VVEVESGPGTERTAAVEAARIAGAGRLDAITADLSAALGIDSG
jgi:hypothetical protein